MAQPILSIKDAAAKSKATANLLPCRVHHNGPADPASTFWNPTDVEDGTKLAYFRGRKLYGKSVKLPEQCRGVILERRDEKKPEAEPEVIDVDEAENIGGTGIMQVTADFNEMIVWGHEAVADASGDPYVRSIEEWLQVADQINSYPEPEVSGQK